MNLDDYQALVAKQAAKHGFDTETVSELFMLLLEGAGEFAKAARKTAGIASDKNSTAHDIEEEAADVFWILLSLCNQMGIKLEEVFAKKAAKNNDRTWA